MAWQITPKVHKLQHVPMLAHGINPWPVQCYNEESHVGAAVKSWRGSAAGRYMLTVQEVVLIKRLVALLLRFELLALEP